MNVAMGHLVTLKLVEIIKMFNSETKYIAALSTKIEWSNKYSMYNLKEEAMKWYTDGSRINTETGAGVFGPGYRHSEPLGNSILDEPLLTDPTDVSIRMLLLVSEGSRRTFPIIRGRFSTILSALPAFFIRSFPYVSKIPKRSFALVSYLFMWLDYPLKLKPIFEKIPNLVFITAWIFSVASRRSFSSTHSLLYLLQRATRKFFLITSGSPCHWKTC